MWDERSRRGNERPSPGLRGLGEHPGLLRAWAVDDETGEWWATCQYYVGTGVQMLGWVHQDHVRPVADLTDAEGLVQSGDDADDGPQHDGQGGEHHERHGAE